MKHNLKITAVLLVMFLVTQLIGLYVVNHYTENSLPYGMQPPTIKNNSEYYSFLPTIVIAFAFAILIFFLLSKFKLETILKIWFFVVVIIALGLAINSFFPASLKYSSFIALAIAIPLATIKIFKREFLIHNLTELLVYPGIAAVFVPIFNTLTIIILLILISIYDMWAVWHSGVMQKMAKYHINKLNIFPGFFLPYASKKIKAKIKLMKQKFSKEELKKKKIKVNVAILGGGDIVFPIITAGVFLRTSSFIPALLVIFGAVLGLSYLFFFAEKKKFYPAMPFITAGIFLGMLTGYLFF